MGLFGIGDDTDTSGSDSGAGFLMPMAAQAMQADPRSAMIQSIMQTGQQQLQQPTYTPLAALAKALTLGIGGASSGYLQKQYAEAAKGAPQEIGAALSSSDPLSALTQSKNPVARMMGFQLAPAIMAKRLEPTKLSRGEILTTASGGAPLATNTMPNTQIGQLQFERQQIAAQNPNDPRLASYDAQIQKLNSEGGVQLTGNGAAPIPGYGSAKGAIAGQTDLGENPALIGRAAGIAGATAPIEVSKAVNIAAGTAPIETQKAVNIAAGTAPIETQKAVNTAAGIAPIEANKEISISAGKAPIEMLKQLFNPIANRTTGAVTIPGVDNPEMVNTILQKFGVTPKQLLDDPAIPSASQSSPAMAAPVARAQGGMTPPAPSPAAIGGASPSAPAASAAGQTDSVPAGAPVPVGTKNPIDEIPKVSLPTGEMPLTPGTISPGRDPIAIKAGEAAVDQAAKQYEEISDSAKAATGMNAQLNAMKTLLGQGRLMTNAAGPAREEVAGWIYAGTGNIGLAKSLTGIDPSAADVFNKESTRLGFNLARQLGAREAAQVVQGAIKANPNLAATVEGNKMVIDTLMQGAQHDIDAQKYADAWFQKNGHYVGAQGWFNQNHPVTEYTSRAIPLQLPRTQDGQLDTGQLQPNATYQGKDGLGTWNGHGFVPVSPIR